uniref:Uncharacterized protein n=1 Tax=Solanum lycopersicum TaxID=4081 RepID=A0A3Q7EQV3_SOLLC
MYLLLPCIIDWLVDVFVWGHELDIEKLVWKLKTIVGKTGNDSSENNDDEKVHNLVKLSFY